ncbi:MAG TPA: alkaline phosphatase D family protein [Terriglobales bacterium]|nr:alkaline phosphatase D family protein [Terriglobales bacterium]
MSEITRRHFLALATAMGASLAWCGPAAARSRVKWREQRERFVEGVASGDPQPDSVVLWTRYSVGSKGAATSAHLTLEVAEDAEFTRVVATTETAARAEADWTCRVLVGGLRPGRVYWYRFTDADGAGSRIGRTITAPADDDPRPVRFAFVSCQNVNQAAQNAYRRMIFEDERAPESERLGFVLHLGDFIYEMVWYPEDRPQGMYDRRLRDIVRYPQGEKIADFHIPVSLDDYRAVYRAYLADPDLQDARARWPFVPMWDNHEFSWLGWQSFQKFEGKTRPEQTRKVAANQAWFEYQPARVRQPAGLVLDRFTQPKVSVAPITRFDENGLGDEPNNLAALRSLTAYRALRWGRHLDLLITDQHSYRSVEPTGEPEAQALSNPDFPEMFPQEAMEILDAGRTYNGGKPPATIRFGDAEIPNFRRDQPPQTILGAEQKKWFLDRLRSSKATWKVWGNSLGTLDWRVDPQNLPPENGKRWPGAGYAGLGGGDHSAAYVERGDIYDLVRDAGIAGFAVVAADRHSFWAGLAAKALPPKAFEPVGVAFITASISAPGLVEAFEHRFPKKHPLRALFLADLPGEAKPHPTVNLLLHHGVRSCLEYQRTGDPARARGLSNPDLSPHLAFIDMSAHGYATVRLSDDAIECEFVCIPRPLERAPGSDGGPIRYRVSHRARLWKPGERPRLEQRILEGDPGLAI